MPVRQPSARKLTNSTIARASMKEWTNSPTARVLVQAWREVAQVQYDALRGITFGDLVARINRQSENMFYI